LIEQIQRDALDPDAPVAETLRKLIALGAEAGSTGLRDWASRELNGYKTRDQELPEYRRVGAVILIDGIAGYNQITGQQIGGYALPEVARDLVGEEVPLNNPIREIEAMLEHAEAEGGFTRLGMPMSQEIVAMMNRARRDGGVDTAFNRITRIYWSIGVPSLHGVLDQIRTKLVELTAEMRAAMPDDAASPSAEVANHAVQVVLNGEARDVNILAAIASGAGPASVSAAGDDRGPWRRIGGFIVAVAIIAGALASVGLWQHWSL
jgi:hypothetical protein